MSTYSVAIIGCGRIARAHAVGWRGVPEARIVAVADIDAEARAAFAAAYGVESAYADYTEMLATEKPDIVSICTWPVLHCEMTVAAAQAGARGILCEKPMCINLGEADRMLEACQTSGSLLIVGHQRRYQVQYRTAHDLIAHGTIGDLLEMRVNCHGDLLSDATHSVDLLRFYCGDRPVEQVIGQIDRRQGRMRFGHPIEDGALAYLFFSGGLRATVEVGSVARRELPYQYALLRGTRGLLEIYGDEAPDDGTGLRMWDDQAGGWRDVQLPSSATDHEPAFVGEAAALVACLESGTVTHPLHGSSARADLEVLMAVYESSRRRAIVELPLHKASWPLQEMIDAGEM
jgi:predicted dehydrogenase